MSARGFRPSPATRAIASAGAAAPDLRPLVAEGGVRERLERLVQRRELACDPEQVLARVELAVQGPQLVGEAVEALEQGVELAVGELLALHAGDVTRRAEPARLASARRRRVAEAAPAAARARPRRPR